MAICQEHSEVVEDVGKLRKILGDPYRRWAGCACGGFDEVGEVDRGDSTGSGTY